MKSQHLMEQHFRRKEAELEAVPVDPNRLQTLLLGFTRPGPEGEFLFSETGACLMRGPIDGELSNQSPLKPSDLFTGREEMLFGIKEKGIPRPEQSLCPNLIELIPGNERGQGMVRESY